MGANYWWWMCRVYLKRAYDIWRSWWVLVERGRRRRGGESWSDGMGWWWWWWFWEFGEGMWKRRWLPELDLWGLGKGRRKEVVIMEGLGFWRIGENWGWRFKWVVLASMMGYHMWWLCSTANFMRLLVFLPMEERRKNYNHPPQLPPQLPLHPLHLISTPPPFTLHL